MKANINLRYLIFLAVTAALGGVLFGFDISIISGAGPFLLQHFGLSDLGLGWAYSALLFGCVLGSVIAGRATDFYGRKKILLLAALLFAITSVATGEAPSFTIFIVARFFGGLAVGAVSIVSPMYVSEISPPSIRGRMGALYQVSILSGGVLSWGINYLLRNAGTDNWRWMFITGVFPSLVFFLMVLFAPETPRYLFKVGRQEESFKLLERIAGKEAAEFQIREIAKSFQTKQGNWRDLLNPGIRRAVIVGFFLAILVQISGISTIIDYAPSIFQAAGWKIDAALLSAFLLGLFDLMFALVSFAIIDRYGRRPVYIVGSIGMTLALLGLVWIAASNQFQGAAIVAPILLFLACFQACIGPVFWTLVPEIFPNYVRGTAMVVPVLAQWVANALVVLFFPFAFNRIGKATTFGFLAAMALAQALFTWYFVPETKNVPLEEIEAFWMPAAVPASKP